MDHKKKLLIYSTKKEERIGITILTRNKNKRWSNEEWSRNRRFRRRPFIKKPIKPFASLLFFIIISLFQLLLKHQWPLTCPQVSTKDEAMSIRLLLLVVDASTWAIIIIFHCWARAAFDWPRRFYGEEIIQVSTSSSSTFKHILKIKKSQSHCVVIRVKQRRKVCLKPGTREWRVEKEIWSELSRRRLSWGRTVLASMHMSLTVLRVRVSFFRASPFLAISSSTSSWLCIYLSSHSHLIHIPPNWKKRVKFVYIITKP